MKKKIIFITIGIVLAVIASVSLIFFFNNRNKKIEVTELEMISPLKNGDSAKAVELAKENIVKVVNKIDDKNTIYGTGFFDKSGYLVTNSHVVDIKGDITVIYQNGKESKAEIFSNDITSDIALLSVEKVNVKAMSFTTTINLSVTDEVYSIGHQLNLEGDATVTKGILSAKRVSSGIEFLQTDAAVNSGGSGGPVINDKCELLGMVTLASENATLSFAISSDTLELYINKLIKSPVVNYVSEQRPTNALSVILKEVNYHTDDIYDEHKYFKKKDEPENDESKKEEHGEEKDSEHKYHDGNNNHKPQVPKDYSINRKAETMVLIETPISNDINTYFTLGKDLTGCSLNTSSVNTSKAGTYSVTVTCNEANSSTNIFVYGVKAPDGTIIPANLQTSNVTDLSQIEGIWFYPGYADVCQIFRYVIDVYDWTTLTMNQIKGTFQANAGGGGQYDSFSSLTQDGKLWVQGNYLVISFPGYEPYVMTRTKGTKIYHTQRNDPNICESHANANH